MSSVLDSKQQLLTLLWLGIQICLMAFTISAWVAAGNMRGLCLDDKTAAEKDHHAGFVLVWQSLLALALSVFGTMVMKRYRNEFSVGFFLGFTVLMCNWMLCTAVLSSGQASHKKELAENCIEYSASSDRAVSSFSVFLFLLYGAFSYLLLKYKDEVLRNEGQHDFVEASFDETSTQAFTSGAEI